MIEMNIDSIRVSLVNSQRVILLKEKMGDRYLPLWIGATEADAIAIKLQGVEVGRPMTHDLLKSTIDLLGSTALSVTINEIKNDTFYAKINLTVKGNIIEIDSRPSDALALAVRTGTPILVSASILNQAGIFLDKESGKPLLNKREEKEAGGWENKVKKAITKEDLDKMSAYSDFLNTLNLDDLNKRQS